MDIDSYKNVDEKIIMEFDEFLSKRGVKFEFTSIGGISLIVQGIAPRKTIDCDVLDPPITKELKELSKEFARTGSGRLIENWFNNGPESLKDYLPVDWRDRLDIIFEGKSLTMKSLGRSDLLKTKLAAYCDRQDDLEDCIAMKPTSRELDEALPWVKEYDANPMWPKHVEMKIDELRAILGL